MRLFFVFALACLSAAPALGAVERATVWDLSLSAKADDLPDRFIDYACGSNGGPAGRLLKNFAEFATCRAEANGLHEVSFRYDDEEEYLARALEEANAIERFQGTRVYGFEAVVSALFDDAGELRGIRIISDPRGVAAGDRNDQWRLGALLKQRYGPDGWTCQDLPLGAGEAPISSYWVKRRCSKSTAQYQLTMSQDYYHRQGQAFTDESGKVQPTFFTSLSRFEVIAPLATP